MRVGAERAIRKWWAGEYGAVGDVARALATPLSWGYGRVIAARAPRRVEERRLPVPVVSVGNLAVGGTGKTPLAGWVVGQVVQRGLVPGVVTHSVATDEAALHLIWAPSAIVEADRDRLRAGERLVRNGAQVVVLDDGFQHRRLGRGLDIVALSSADRFPGPVLPAGPYRERPDALARADVVVITHRQDGAGVEGTEAESWEERLSPFVPAAGQPVVAHARLLPTELRPLDGEGASAELSGVDVVACAAVARPETFYAAVSDRARSVEVMGFADHHPYGAADAERIRRLAAGRPVVVTAKDAVKLQPYAHEIGSVFVLDERLLWIEGEDRVRGALSRLFEEVGG